MANLSNVLLYIFMKHPEGTELTPTRIVRLAYLADWKSVLEVGEPITDVQWSIVNFEPKVDDTSLQHVTKFTKRKLRNIFTPIALKIFGWHLSNKQKSIIDSVIQSTTKKDSQQIKQLVYSTYPAITQDESDVADLQELAQKYKRFLGEGKRNFTTKPAA